MPKFMFIYRAEPSSEPASPEQMQEVMAHWMSWIEDGSKQGWIVDAGDALMPEGQVIRASDVVTDGPFAEAKELVNGFSIVQAESLAAATKLVKGCPIFDAGGCLEVRPLAEVGS